MAGILATIIQIFYYMLLARMVISFVPKLRHNPIGQVIYNVTEPVLAPFRGLIPPMGGLDFSPMILFVILNFIQRAIS